VVTWLEAFGVDAHAVGPNVWLQSFASDGLTRLANVVSFFGYTAVYIAFAALLAFAWRRRAGLSLLILLALTSMCANAAKVLVDLPRPDAVSARVATLSDVRPTEAAETGGFPSGHVAASAEFELGLVYLPGWRGAIVPGALWVAAMAWSRMYLGRHFLADVLGGAALAAIVCAAAIAVVHLRRPDAWPAPALATALAVLAVMAGLPLPYDAGRLLGFAAGGFIACRFTRDDDEAPFGRRVMRVALAAAAYGAAWWITTAAVDALAPPDAAGALVRGLVPACVVVYAPSALTAHMTRATR
jgi:membrane-associated phospholipid phosphatase